MTLNADIRIHGSRRTAIVGWSATIGLLVVAIVALHHLGANPAFAVDWADPWRWLGTHSTERVLMGLSRVIALALAYWIAGTMLAYTAARATRIPALIRSFEWMTLPAARRIAERVVTISLTASTLASGGIGTAVAAETPLPSGDSPVVAHLQRPHASASQGYVPVPAGEPPSVPAPTSDETATTYTPTPAVMPTPMPIASTRTTVVVPSFRFDPRAADLDAQHLGQTLATMSQDYEVASGDNLWLIAERHLESVLGEAPTDSETATYWSHLIAANRSRLRSGNPDLIYPGEIVLCPPAAEVGLGR